MNNIEKQRRHLRTSESSEEIEATIDCGAARCLFPRDPCDDNQTARTQKITDEGIWTIENSTEYGFRRRLMGAVASVQQILLTVNERNGRKILMDSKNGVDTNKLWTKGARPDKNTNPKLEELGTLSGKEQVAGMVVSPRLNPLIAPSHLVPAAEACNEEGHRGAPCR